MTKDLSIKVMKLYAKAASIIADLSDLGFAQGSPLDFNEVCKIDQLHYHGVASVQLAIDALAIEKMPMYHKLAQVGVGHQDL